MKALLDEIKKIIADERKYRFNFEYLIWKTDFLRFYDSQINYNISKDNYVLTGTIEQDKRKFTFELSNPTLDDLTNVIEQGKKILKKLPSDNNFYNFEDNLELYQYQKSELEDNIKKVALEKKVEILEKLATLSAQNGFNIYGTFITLVRDKYILNSNGLDKHFFQSPIMLDVKAVAKSNMVTVIDSFGSNNFDRFNFDEFSQRLLRKIEYAKNEVIDIEPGEYEAILGPHAVKEFLQYLMYGAYTSSLYSKVSCFEDAINKKILPEYVSISSIPNHPNIITIPYNSEGHLAKRVDVITNGVFKNYFVDNYYGKLLKMEKNGAVGVKALVMDKGDISLDDMIKNMKKGIYISNIHYMNFINQKETSVTGLTRDGTFLIENGEITKTINNLRYTETILDIFNNILEIENKQYSVPTSSNYDNFEIYSSFVPHIKTGKFKISSSTKTI